MIRPGSVIAYRDKRALLLARVLREEGAQLRVVSEKGREFPYPRDRVALALPETKADLAALKAEAEAVASDVDMALVWETVRELEPDGASLAALAETYFGSAPTPVRELGFLMALEADSAHFKQKGELWVPKDPEAVAETLRQREEAERRERERREGFGWLKGRLAGKVPASEAPPPGAAPLLELLIAGAVKGEEGPSWAKAAELVRELGASGPEGAFQILVRLGRFHEDENLAIHAFDVPVAFPAPVVAEAERLAATPPREEPRLDLRALETISIDDPETTEVDDALSLEALEGGRVRAWIHIADPSPYVPKGSLVDREALRRATTVYAPDRTIPMLPEVLSMGLVSLKPGVDRLAFSVSIELSPEGEVLGHGFHPSRVKVGRALAYEEVDAAVTGDGLVARLYRLATLLRARREKAGAQSYERQELRVKVDAQGRISVKKLVGDSQGQVLVSELMVLANFVAGKALAEAGVPALFKRQARPEGGDPGFIPKSTLGTIPGEHFGLAVPFYSQMTSPIRRYGDLAVHRQLGTMVGRPGDSHTLEELGVVMAACQDRDEASGAVEREGRRYFLLKYLRQHPIKEHAAVATGVRRGGLTGVRLEDYLLPCMMPLPQGVSLKEGDRLTVFLESVVPREGKTRLRFVGLLPPRALEP